MRMVKIFVGVVACVSFLFAYSASAAPIQNIQGTLCSTDWYNGSGDYFKPLYQGGGSDAQINILGFYTQGQVVPDYYMYYGSFAMDQSALVQDKTSHNPGGLALGVFESGATLTIKGDLWRDFGDYDLAASDDLIIADVKFRWELEEQPVGYPSNTVRGQAFFDITGGALSSPSLNADGLVMGDFYIEFTFESCNPTVTDFSNALGNAIYNCNAPIIQIGVVPEPVSLALLGIGGLTFIRRRRY